MATEGVTSIFSWKTGDLFFSSLTVTFIDFTRVSPPGGCHPATFLLDWPRLSAVLCKFAHKFFSCLTSSPPPSDATVQLHYECTWWRCHVVPWLVDPLQLGMYYGQWICYSMAVCLCICEDDWLIDVPPTQYRSYRGRVVKMTTATNVADDEVKWNDRCMVLRGNLL